jgi:hypothetical protein
VNDRTLVNCYDSRRMSRRMRQELAEVKDAGGIAGDEPGDVDADDVEDMEGEPLERRVAALEDENRGLGELVERQAVHLEELARRVAALEGREGKPSDDTKAVDAGDDLMIRRGIGSLPVAGPECPARVWLRRKSSPTRTTPSARRPHLVAEWRRLQAGGDQSACRVDRAQAAARRWELEAMPQDEFHLTLPPDTDPLDHARRVDHVHWRRDALAEARRESGRAKRARWLRRVLILGLWRG